MISSKGFGLITVVIAVAIIVALGGGAYAVTHPEAMHPPMHEGSPAVATTSAEDASAAAAADAKIGIHWSFKDAGEKENIPYTEVSLNGKVVGEYQGSCAEIGASGGIDGKGLVAGELSAVQCYFAGAGDEIGVFANEDGGTEVMVGSLEEPIEGGAGSRGDFKIRTDVKL